MFIIVTLLLLIYFLFIIIKYIYKSLRKSSYFNIIRNIIDKKVFYKIYKIFFIFIIKFIYLLLNRKYIFKVFIKALI